MLRVSQRAVLFGLPHVCWPLFSILEQESFRHARKAFILPTGDLAAIRGLSRPRLRLLLRQMEAGGLISIQRRPAKPPLITVLQSRTNSL
jgi:hypothetical protein